jgi:hypothetical protein
MGFARRVVRKSVRRATPRQVRRAMHPARAARNAVTPRPVKRASRAAYTARHPVGAAENAMIGAALNPPSLRRRRGGCGFGAFGVIAGLILLAVFPWWVPVLIIPAAILIPLIAWRTLDPSRGRRIRAMRSQGPDWPGPISPLAGPVSPRWPPVPPASPPDWQPPVPQAPASQWPRVEPWPSNRAFRTPPPDVTPPGHPVTPPSSAGDWELDARRRTGLGDGSRNQ